MPKTKCIVVDDNELDRLTLYHLLSQYEDFSIVGIYEDPERGLAAIQNLQPNVVFLDVDMPGMSGMELRKKVTAVPVCVFITDHPEFAVDGFDLEALDYLIKPISEKRFKKTIERIRTYMDLLKKKTDWDRQNKKRIIFIKEGHQKIKVSLDDILYLETLQNYTTLITENRKYHILTSLSALLKKNDFKDFIRIHRSYAVQKKHVKSYSSKEILLVNNKKLGIGRSYKEQVQKKLRLISNR